MENLYHYIWKTKLRGTDFTDIDGNSVTVIDPGIYNHDSGPDFFNAKIKLNGNVWAGNVEIHVKASDWYRHGHDKDHAYDNVILHVVAVSDKRVRRADGSVIPQIELTFPEKFFHILSTLGENNNSVRCASWISSIPRLNFEDWLETLSMERMQQKAQRVKNLLKVNGGDWEQTCFILLARGMGFGLNGEPFELLGKSIPLKILHHHSDNIMQLEALMFGQAAMLDPTYYMFDEYFQSLCREYYFLAKKYGLRPINYGLWKYSRTRPQNFPHRRIAFLANSTLGGFSIFSRLLELAKNSESLMSAFEMKAEGYWKTHFSFNSESSVPPMELSYSSRVLLAINVAIPILYAYASETGDLEMGEKVTSLMLELPSENNNIIRDWKNLGIPANDAARSQALIHLRKEYCEKKECMKCRFGHHLLRKSAY